MLIENVELFTTVIVYGILLGGLYSLAAVGLTLIFGVLRFVNIAHGEFVMLGMYFSFWMLELFHVDPLLSLLLALPLFFVGGCVIERVLVKRLSTAPSSSQVLFTVGLSLFLVNLAQFVWSPDWRSVVTPLTSERVVLTADLSLSLVRVSSFVIAMVMAASLYLFMIRTDTGRAIRAVVQNRQVASLMGISIEKISMISFGLGISLTGAAGVLLSQTFTIYPSVGIDTFLMKSFAVIVLGGMETVIGTMVAGLVLGIGETMGATYISVGYSNAISFIILVIMLIVKPTGIFGKTRA